MLLALPLVSQTQPSKTVQANDVWFVITEALSKAADPPQLYQNNIRDAVLPGSGKHWRGTVVSDPSEDRPDELLISISNATTPEIRLRVRDREISHVRAGDAIEFQGIARDVQWDPFLLTLQNDEKMILNLRPARP